jgi:hypothetical protein
MLPYPAFIFSLAANDRMLALRVIFSPVAGEDFKTATARMGMENIAVGNTEAACKNTRPKEEHSPYSWLEDYLDRLEEKEAREECSDSYEYCALMASLLA